MNLSRAACVFFERPQTSTGQAPLRKAVLFGWVLAECKQGWKNVLSAGVPSWVSAFRVHWLGISSHGRVNS